MARQLAAYQHSDRVFLEHDANARRFQQFFIDFEGAVRSGRVLEVYAQDAYLNDSLKELQGASEIDAYFRKTLETATSVRVSFEDAAVSGDNYYFRWVMDVEAPKLNKGEVVRSVGMTHVTFDDDGKVTMHWDYWDSASGLYQYLPVIGGMMGYVKSRL